VKIKFKNSKVYNLYSLQSRRVNKKNKMIFRKMESEEKKKYRKSLTAKI